METQDKLSLIIRIDDRRLALVLIGEHPKLFFGFVNNKTGCDWFFVDDEDLRATAHMYECELLDNANE